jgi:hypothetical protein
LFVFCSIFFVLGVLLMGLASMQVYVDLVSSWRHLRKERRSHEPERRELERARSALAREREDHEPKRRELEFRSTELDHRTEELKRDREAVAQGRSHLAAERADLAKERADLSASHHALERERSEVEAARAALQRERSRSATELRNREIERASDFANPAAPAETVSDPVPTTTGAELASVGTDPSPSNWDLAGQLDDDVAAVARMARESPPAEGPVDADRVLAETHATDPAATAEPDPSR